MTLSLDDSLALDIVGPGRLRGVADPAHEANTGMFGGWTAALLLRAVLVDRAADGSPLATTVSFLNRIPPGSSLDVRTQRLGGGRSLAHFRADLVVEGSDELAATATVVLGRRRESDRFTELKMPDATAPESLPQTRPGLRFGERTDLRYVLGGTWFDQPTTRSLVWEREVSGRHLDAVQLAYLCDIGAPRVFYVSHGPRPCSTMTLSLYVHAADQELAAAGDDFVLSDMVGTRIEQSTVGSRANIWSRSGALLATTEQLCWFK
jgi:acyl-CoA thioesterase